MYTPDVTPSVLGVTRVTPGVTLSVRGVTPFAFRVMVVVALRCRDLGDVHRNSSPSRWTRSAQKRHTERCERHARRYNDTENASARRSLRWDRRARRCGASAQ